MQEYKLFYQWTNPTSRDFYHFHIEIGHSENCWKYFTNAKKLHPVSWKYFNFIKDVNE